MKIISQDNTNYPFNAMRPVIWSPAVTKSIGSPAVTKTPTLPQQPNRSPEQHHIAALERSLEIATDTLQKIMDHALQLKLYAIRGMAYDGLAASAHAITGKGEPG